jgi:hypothetical protein
MTMKKLTVALFSALAMAAAPLAVAPPASAEICGGGAGRHVAVGGCSHPIDDIAAGVAIANDDDWAAQERAGQPPCYTASGVPYYTPGSDPCYLSP